MSRKNLTAINCVASLILLLLTAARSFGQTSTLVQIVRSGSGSLSSTSPGPDVIANPEVDPALVGDADTDLPLSGGKVINRSIATQVGVGPHLATGFACGGTRTSLANWYTRISQLVP